MILYCKAYWYMHDYSIEVIIIIQGRRKWYGLNGNGRTGFQTNCFYKKNSKLIKKNENL